VTVSDPPDPLIVVLGEIRDVLAEIRDAVKPKAAPTVTAMPTRGEAKRPPNAQRTVIG
jgi:hypothetical protein